MLGYSFHFAEITSFQFVNYHLPFDAAVSILKASLNRARQTNRYSVAGSALGRTGNTARAHCWAADTPCSAGEMGQWLSTCGPEGFAEKQYVKTHFHFAGIF
jgi:hypothetical protein